MATELPRGEGNDYTIYPDPLTEPYKTRRFQVGELLYRAVDIPREDKPARYRQYARNYQFFGAPVGAVLRPRKGARGRRSGPICGGYLQTVALLARAFGLHSCPQQAWVSFNRTVREFLELPDHLMIYSGMALGHEDPARADQSMARAARAARRFLRRSTASRLSGLKFLNRRVQPAFTGRAATLPPCRFPDVSPSRFCSAC